MGIARALTTTPDILLCDEATSALDPQTTESILKLLKKINREMGVTILLITHQMQVVQMICNKVAVMENGQVVEAGSVLDVFGKPQAHVTCGWNCSKYSGSDRAGIAGECNVCVHFAADRNGRENIRS